MPLCIIMPSAHSFVCSMVYNIWRQYIKIYPSLHPFCQIRTVLDKTYKTFICMYATTVESPLYTFCPSHESLVPFISYFLNICPHFFPCYFMVLFVVMEVPVAIIGVMAILILRRYFSNFYSQNEYCLSLAFPLNRLHANVHLQ